MDDALKQHLVLAREQYEKREYDLAERNLLEVLKLTDAYADVHNMLGVIHHDRGDFQEARKHFENAMRINPNYTEAALNLAVTYNDLGLYGDARKIYDGMLSRGAGGGPRSIDPFARGKLANLHADVGQAYLDFGMLPEAAAEYRKALWLCPQFADLRTKLGSILRDMGQLDAAVREYEDALGYNPRYVPARVLLGVTLFSLQRRTEAEQQWKTALADDPENKSAQMYLRMVQGNALRSAPPPRPSQEELDAIGTISLAETRPTIDAAKVAAALPAESKNKSG
jgi:tetratricopeptide (TPR) repeat protein